LAQLQNSLQQKSFYPLAAIFCTLTANLSRQAVEQNA
jgi:hypothetical protein